jgi:hypothetical protein
MEFRSLSLSLFNHTSLFWRQFFLEGDCKSREIRDRAWTFKGKRLLSELAGIKILALTEFEAKHTAGSGGALSVTSNLVFEKLSSCLIYHVRQGRTRTARCKLKSPANLPHDSSLDYRGMRLAEHPPQRVCQLQGSRLEFERRQVRFRGQPLIHQNLRCLSECKGQSVVYA